MLRLQRRHKFGVRLRLCATKAVEVSRGVAGLRGWVNQGQGLGPCDVPAHSPEEHMREAI